MDAVAPAGLSIGSTALLFFALIMRRKEVDAIKEANLFLKFGRYKQAKEVLHDALVIEPNNHAVRLKILEIEENFREGRLVRAG